RAMSPSMRPRQPAQPRSDRPCARSKFHARRLDGDGALRENAGPRANGPSANLAPRKAVCRLVAYVRLASHPSNGPSTRWLTGLRWVDRVPGNDTKSQRAYEFRVQDYRRESATRE